MSMSDNVNINNPGGEKFPPKKYNISSDPTETETRTESVSASGNDLSKDSTPAGATSSNNNIKCDISGEDSRDDNIIVDKEAVSETAAEAIQSTLKLESNQKSSDKAGSPKPVNTDVENAGVIAPSKPEENKAENSLSTIQQNLEQTESTGSETGGNKDTPAEEENSEQADEPIEVDEFKDDIEVVNESDEDETQEYALQTADQDAHRPVGYSARDFDTETDSDKFGSDSDRESDNKRAGKNMGGILGKAASKKQQCQGSSSEGEDERPWRNEGNKGKKTAGSQPRKNYNLRPSQVQRGGLAHLKRQWSDHDTKMYRSGYPGKRDNPKDRMNVLFYKGRIPSKPDGVSIDEFHEDWWNDYERLERHHGFIQWLFPIRESGMNWHAQELQLHEAEAIRNDPAALKRFIKSYEMMLNFYGIRLVDRDTGAVKRAGNYRERFQHLNHSMHNYLRITRILKCLGEMGLEHYKVPFLKFMLREAIVTGLLDRTLESCYNYWIGTVKDDRKREHLRNLAERWSRGERTGEDSGEEEEKPEKRRESRERIAKGAGPVEGREAGRQRKRSGEDSRQGSKDRKGEEDGEYRKGREGKKTKEEVMEYEQYDN